MKCLVMAGGAGNRLWPLSRRSYPKQFVQIRNGHSMFQETIARNLPYCEEFIICTTEEYLPIITSQLQVFQHLKYRCIVEEISCRTAPPTLLACLCENPSEMILFASTDHMIEGEGYKAAILETIQLLREGKMACFGVPPTDAIGEHGMLRAQKDGGVICHEKVTQQEARALMQEDGWLWDCGIQAFCAGDFLIEFRKYNNSLYQLLKRRFRTLDTAGKYIHVPADMMKDILPLGIGGAVTGKSKKMVLLPCTFIWNRVMTLQTLADYYGRDCIGDAIVENCENVSVINYAKQRLAVANGIKNVVIVQTDDAVYVTDRDNSQQIREIGLAQDKKWSHYFETSRTQMHNWGEVDILTKEASFCVRKSTIYPLYAVSLTKVPNVQRFEITVAQGHMDLYTDDGCAQYAEGDHVVIDSGVEYRIVNSCNDDLVIIETIWNHLEGPVEPYLEGENVATIKADPIIRLEPAFKDYIWGGTQLRTKLGKKCDYERIAESWELSMHRAGQSTVGSGHCVGMLFGDYVKAIGKQSLGWKSIAFDRFPLLIKFIDAKEDLSIQVHPNDDYALRYEDDYGKCEMWHIIDCEDNAYIYYGFSRTVTRQEVEDHIKNGSLLEILNKVHVKKGQNIMIEAGVVHAIGRGILLCEIQQSSNVTYRLFDYDRRDKYGNKRELHVEKALDVLRYDRQETDDISCALETGICESKYFFVAKKTSYSQITLLGDESSFTAIVILTGSGNITVDQTSLPYKMGDTFFVPAEKNKIEIYGESTFLHVRI